MPAAAVLPASAAKGDESAHLAFQLHLKPSRETADSATKPVSAGATDNGPKSDRSASAATHTATAARSDTQPEFSTQDGEVSASSKPAEAGEGVRARKVEPDQAGAVAADAQSFVAEGVRANPETGTGHVAAPPPAAPQPPASRPAETQPPARTAAANPVDLLPEAPKPAASTHDIRLQVNGGDHRVELRLTQKDGDVHVAVRTPDARLAGQLREDLPALAAKLEQTGFKTETATAAAGDRGRVPDPSPAPQQGSGEQAGQQGGQRQNEQQQQREQKQRPGDVEMLPETKADGKDFQWMLTSLR
jgi:hypothetical protein